MTRRSKDVAPRPRVLERQRPVRRAPLDGPGPDDVARRARRAAGVGLAVVGALALVTWAAEPADVETRQVALGLVCGASTVVGAVGFALNRF